MTAIQIFDNGTVFPPSILDIDEKDLLEHVLTGIKRVAALSLRIGFPTAASVPHSVVNAFKNLLAVSVATDYTFAQSEKIKAYLADPSAFAVAAPAATTEAAAAPAAKEEAKKEESEASDDDMGFGLFD